MPGIEFHRDDDPPTLLDASTEAADIPLCPMDWGEDPCTGPCNCVWDDE